MYDIDDDELTPAGGVTTDERPPSPPAPRPPPAPAAPATVRTPELIRAEIAALQARMFTSSSAADRARVEALSKELHPPDESARVPVSPEAVQAALEGDGSSPTVDRLLALIGREPAGGWDRSGVDLLAGAIARAEPDAQVAAGLTFQVLQAVVTTPSGDPPEADATDASLRRLWGPKHAENLALAQAALPVLFPNPTDRARVTEYLEATGLGDHVGLVVLAEEFMTRRRKKAGAA